MAGGGGDEDHHGSSSRGKSSSKNSDDGNSSDGGDSDDDDSAAEGLRILLGGLRVEDVRASAWDDEEECLSGGGDGQYDADGRTCTVCGVPSTDARNREDGSSEATKGRNKIGKGAENSGRRQAAGRECDVECSGGSSIFDYAHRMVLRLSAATKIGRPPVRVVDLADVGRGKGLAANEFLPKGTVIYTERAALATQVPQQQPPPPTAGDGTSSAAPASAIPCYGVRACQHCFRSLESASRLAANSASSSTSDVVGLPMQHLWPVPPLSFPSTSCNKSSSSSNNNNDDDTPDDGESTTKPTTEEDPHGRLRCVGCGALFCTRQCHELHVEEQGSCCAVSEVLGSLPSLLAAREAGEDDEEEDEAAAVEVQPAVALAVRMFGYSLRRLRNSVGDTSRLGRGSALDGLCGEASDLTPLELGYVDDDDGGDDATDAKISTKTPRRRYTLKRVYKKMASAWSMTDDELQILTLDRFHGLAAAAGRNGVGVATQSPFQVYYNSLLRTTTAGGCRGSQRHMEVKRQVATALGSETGELRRGMDREVDAAVAAEVVALFPLTARINHSCRPNAQIRGQEFVDCRIDLVALDDVQNGEEITISYVATGFGVGRKRKHQRRRELAAKYLFHCNCAECSAS